MNGVSSFERPRGNDLGIGRDVCFGHFIVAGERDRATGQPLTLVESHRYTGSRSWVIDYRLRNAASCGVIITPEEFELKVVDGCRIRGLRATQFLAGRRHCHTSCRSNCLLRVH